MPNPKHLALVLSLMVMPAAVAGAAEGITREERMARNVHAFTVKTIDGKDKPLADYRGKVLLIVNTASRCGFTPQYKSLQALYEKYGAKGFEILGFPSNDFKGQEPGSDAEIKSFCELKYKVTFPLFSKITVKGEGMHPLYGFLTAAPGFSGDISWNFNKFLVDGSGNVVARFGSRTDPLDPSLVAELEKQLHLSRGAA